MDDHNEQNEGQEKKGRSFSATRHHLQLGRRLFHMSTGVGIATTYALFLGHQEVVSALGLGAALLYLFEQIRLSYPELGDYLKFINSFLLRAEEQLKESAAMPYMMGLLLTIISFPKPIAVLAIYTLSVADPLSAIVGILYGTHPLAGKKTLEGSGAFFVGTFFCTLFVLVSSYGAFFASFKTAFCTAFFGTLFELIPLRLDDNLTIPLFTALLAWLFATFFGVFPPGLFA